MGLLDDIIKSVIVAFCPSSVVGYMSTVLLFTDLDKKRLRLKLGTKLLTG